MQEPKIAEDFKPKWRNFAKSGHTAGYSRVIK